MELPDLVHDPLEVAALPVREFLGHLGLELDVVWQPEAFRRCVTQL
ncbi:MAG TPA: hypothetical protein VK425_02695 [Acidimicrobiales bacterium]|nr:hypothetical protein [Acidimicrobiales bacterium]